jgi:hypothetical protein
LSSLLPLVSLLTFEVFNILFSFFINITYLSALIYYFYSGELKLTPGQCVHLLAHLDFYALMDCERLKVLSEDIINNFSRENCWELLEIAKSYKLQEIVGMVCSYLTSNINSLTAEEKCKFDAILKEQPVTNDSQGTISLPQFK